MLTEVDYRTGRKTRHGAPDRSRPRRRRLDGLGPRPFGRRAARSIVAGAGADFAVGCTYKFLNAGPGAPAFIYVAPGHIDRIRPALSGWLGHEAPFAFDLDYRSGRGIERMRVGTPPIIAFAALDAALDVWNEVSMHDVRARSMELGELFIAEVETVAARSLSSSARGPPKTAARRCRSGSSTHGRPCRRSSTGGSSGTFVRRTSCGSESPRSTWMRRT